MKVKDTGLPFSASQFLKSERFYLLFESTLLLLFFWTLCFFPRWNIGKDQLVEFENQLPLSLEAGRVILLDQSNEWRYSLEDQKSFTPIEGTNKIFAISPLYGNSNIYVIKWKKSIPTSFWKLSPEVPFALTCFSIQKESLEESTRLRIPSTVWKKVSEPDEEQREIERTQMREALSDHMGNFVSPCLQTPLDSKVTSLFGSPRTLPNGKKYYHTGVDLRASMNTPIQSMADGTVKLAQEMIVPGNIVVVHHGGGLFSRYMHLNKIEVQSGEKIKMGQTIGFSGQTGRVEAPHLHWEIIWRGNHSNPHRFLQDLEPICDQE